MKFVIALGVALFALIIVFIILNIIDHYDTYYTINPKTAIRLKYKNFVDFYSINPDKWELFKNYCAYKLNDDEGYLICFNYFDKLRYNQWLNESLLREQDERKSESTRILLRDIQKDIQKKREQTQAEIHKAMEESIKLGEEIRLRWKEDKDTLSILTNNHEINEAIDNINLLIPIDKTGCVNTNSQEKEYAIAVTEDGQYYLMDIKTGKRV